LCTHTGCGERAVYHTDNCRPTRCAKHRAIKMIHRRSDICQHPGCTVTASFGPLGSRLRSRCAAHKPPDWTYQCVTCSVVGCSTPPQYGPVGVSPARCAEHRIPEDSLCMRCSFCRSIARYRRTNFPSLLCCKKHWTDTCEPLSIGVLHRPGRPKKNGGAYMTLAEISDLLGMEGFLNPDTSALRCSE